jgi:hypothetical protein
LVTKVNRVKASLERFILLFPAVGCPDLTVARDQTVTRTDSEAIINCINTEQKWTLRCRGVHWLGIFGNCTKPGKLPHHKMTVIHCFVFIAVTPIGTPKPKVIPPVQEDTPLIEKGWRACMTSA